MPAQLDHTIVHARDQQVEADFLTEVLGLPPATPFGHFLVVQLANGVSLDVAESPEDGFSRQHYAFLVSEQEFDEIFGRIRDRGLEYWADPTRRQPGEINRHDGGRGCYFLSPNGHVLEIITRRYGSGG